MKDVTWRSLKEHPGQLVLAVLSVIVGVALATVTLCIGDIMNSAYSSIVSTSTSADVYVVPKDADPASVLTHETNKPLISDTLTSAVSGLSEVAVTLALYRGPVILVDGDGNRVSAGYTISLAQGADPNTVESSELVDGNFPTNNTEIALESTTAARSGLAIGDETQIIANGRVMDVTVVGIVAYDTPLNGSVLVIVDRMTAKVLFAPSGMVPSIAVKVSEKSTPEAAKAAIEASLPVDSGAEVLLGTELRAAAAISIRHQLAFVSAFLLIFAAIAFIVSGFLIANTFAAIVRQRTRQDGILKAVGASRNQVFGSILSEALVAGAIGSVLGVGIGYVLVVVLRQVLGLFGLHLTDTIPVTFLSILIPLVVGIVVSVIAAAIPAFKGARLNALNALAADQLMPEKAGWVRGLVGVLLFFGGATALYFALQGYYPDLYFAIGAVAALVGIVVLAPVLVRPLMRILAWPFEILSRLSGILARQNVTRRPRRTVAAAAPFMVGMALVAAVTILASTASVSLVGSVGQETKADFVMRSADAGTPFPQTAVDQVRQLPSTKVYVFGTPAVTVTLPDGEPAAATVMYGPDSTFTDAMKTPIVSGAAEDFSKGSAMSATFAEANGYKLGDMIAFTLCPNTPYQADAELPITVIIDSHILSDVILPASWLQKNIPAQIRQQAMPVAQVMLAATDPSLRPTLLENLQSIAEPYYTISVQSAEEYADSGSGDTSRIMALLYALLALSVIVALLAIVNTLSWSVSANTREIAVLRASGVTTGQVGRTVTIESILIAVFGALVGILVGSGLAVVAQRVFAENGLTTLSIPWIQLVVFFIGSGVVGFIAALGPSRRASHTPVLDAITQE
ncbi:MAG: FtsX-like permease family protein [Propionibacteriaceae bacterium]|jgi:putative ABC transport system permease protein|nr:FtsX-like permease family protein [Propionibacteriaceae bacterium]